MNLPSKKKPAMSKRKKLGIAGVALAGTVVVALLVGGITTLAYASKALPGSTLAGRDISGMTSAGVAEVINEISGAIAADITVGGTTKRATANDLGIVIDAEATVDQAIASKPFWLYRFGMDKKYPLSLTVDSSKVEQWLKSAFPEDIVPPTDASLAFNPETAQYDVVPNSPGQGITEEDLDSLQDALKNNADTASVTFVPTEVPAQVSDDDMSEIKESADQIVSTPFTLTYNDEVMYTFTAEQIAGVLDIDPTDQASQAVSADPAKVETLLNDTVAPAVNLDPVTEKVYVDSSDKTVSTQVKGVVGRQLTDISTTAATVAEAITTASSTSVALTFTEIPFEVTKTRKPAGGSSTSHWADVNLTTQTVTLLDGDTPVSTFTVSTGRASSPTPTGTFSVRKRSGGGSRVANTVSIPEVENVGVGGSTYLYNSGGNWDLIKDTDGDGLADTESWSLGISYWVGFHPASGSLIGFHDAYWHNNFGQPVSHGCVNMRLADVKATYDWLSVSSTVVVHY